MGNPFATLILVQTLSQEYRCAHTHSQFACKEEEEEDVEEGVAAAAAATEAPLQWVWGVVGGSVVSKQTAKGGYSNNNNTT